MFDFKVYSPFFLTTSHIILKISPVNLTVVPNHLILKIFIISQYK